MQKVRTVQSRSADNTEEYISAEPKDCDYVFLRTDSARKGLQRLYTGPYEVIARRRHSFAIKANYGHETVANHPLKPDLRGPARHLDLPSSVAPENESSLIYRLTDWWEGDVAPSYMRHLVSFSVTTISVLSHDSSLTHV